jgi:hypothetical protein
MPARSRRTNKLNLFHWLVVQSFRSVILLECAVCKGFDDLGIAGSSARISLPYDETALQPFDCGGGATSFCKTRLNVCDGDPGVCATKGKFRLEIASGTRLLAAGFSSPRPGMGLRQAISSQRVLKSAAFPLLRSWQAVPVGFLQRKERRNTASRSWGLV